MALCSSSASGCEREKVFDIQKLLAPSCWLLAKACDPLPAWDWVWDWVALGVAQASPKGHPRVDLDKCFVCNRNGKIGGGGELNCQNCHDCQKSPKLKTYSQGSNH